MCRTKLNRLLIVLTHPDAYFERGLHLWDYAAGALIAQESGAVVSGLHPEQPAGFELTLAGAPLTVSELRPLLISGNAAF